VRVPRGAVDEPTTFTVASSPRADGLPFGKAPIGPMITFGPEGSRFALPVRVSVPASGAPTVLLTRSRGGAWERVDGATYDAARGVIEADVLHFSDFVGVVRDAGEEDAGPGHDPCPRGDCVDAPGPFPDCLVFGGDRCTLAGGVCLPERASDTAGYCVEGTTTRLGLHASCAWGEGASSGDACERDLFCTATEGTPGHCARACDETHACPPADSPFGAVECVPLPGRPYGECVANDCNPVEDLRCAVGQHCAYVATGGSSSGVGCVVEGAGGLGDACEAASACAAGLSCMQLAGFDAIGPTYAAGGSVRGGQCMRLCEGGDSTPDEACAAGELCHPILDRGETRPSRWGVCATP
jgi:hypothetical protein